MPDPADRTMLRPYMRSFVRPLRAAWGTWHVRQGWLMRSESSASRLPGYGEVCPLPNGPSLGGGPGAFASEMAFAQWSTNPPPGSNPRSDVLTASLLSLDRQTAASLDSFQADGYSTHKIKVGMRENREEWTLLEPILSHLASHERVRLDPNRAWTDADWDFWEKRLTDYQTIIEFIEEPFPAGTDPALWMDRAHRSPVPFALDESLLGPGLEEWQARSWPGYWIIKPSLMGTPEHWLSKLEWAAQRIILSSAFETAVGMTAILRLAERLPEDTVHGLGTQSWFDDDWGLPQSGPRISPIHPSALEALWNSIPA